MHLRAGAAVLIAGLALAGCELAGEKRNIPCPEVLILGDAEKLVRFVEGSGRETVAFEARIADFRGSCDYDDNGVEVEMFVEIAVERGAANEDPEVAFEYFVALPAHLSRPGGKRILPVKGRFENGTMTYRDDVAVFVPLGKPDDGPATLILLGLQLTPEEVEFNRR